MKKKTNLLLYKELCISYIIFMDNPIDKNDVIDNNEAINKNEATNNNEAINKAQDKTTSVEDVDSVIRQIEKEGMEAVKNLPNRFCQESLLNIMKKGETTFIEKTGRQMTYAEMRATYG